MIKLNNIGNIYRDGGNRFYRLPFKLNDAGISVEMGTIPPKNYFHFKMTSVGVAIDHQVPKKYNKISSVMMFQTDKLSQLQELWLVGREVITLKYPDYGEI